jgi:predicted nucleotidyltransferase
MEQIRTGKNFMSTLEQLRAHRAELIAIGEQYGVSSIRVFGSVARGEETPEMDHHTKLRTHLRRAEQDETNG